MEIAWDVEIPMTDGGLLRANVYLPPDAGGVPALVAMGPYSHDDPDDRPNVSFADWATIHSGPEAQSGLLVPVTA